MACVIGIIQLPAIQKLWVQSHLDLHPQSSTAVTHCVVLIATHFTLPHVPIWVL